MVEPFNASKRNWPLNLLKIRSSTRHLAIAQIIKKDYERRVLELEKQIANERHRAELALQLLVLESGPATMTQTIGNLRLSLHPLAQEDGSLPLRIAIKPEPGVVVGDVKAIQIDEAIDNHSHALSAETHIKPSQNHTIVTSTVVMNGQQIIMNNGQQIIINRAPGGQIIINGPGGINIKDACLSSRHYQAHYPRWRRSRASAMIRR